MHIQEKEVPGREANALRENAVRFDLCVMIEKSQGSLCGWSVVRKENGQWMQKR